MSAQPFAIKETSPDTLAVSGELTFQTAVLALSEARTALAGGRHSVLDLAGVGSVDSAGLACVLAVLADVRRQGGNLHVVNMPAGMRTLAQVADVDALIG